MQFILKVCGNIVGYADNRDSAEISAASYSKTATEFGVDIYGLRVGQFVWMARFTDGRCVEKVKGYGPLCPGVR